MGVYIAGMMMPKNCAECLVNMGSCKRGYKYRIEHLEVYEKRADDCPLVEVKAQHGRLIDADALIAKHEKEKVRDYDFHVCAKNWIANAPTVLEAEGKDDG